MSFKPLKYRYQNFQVGDHEIRLRLLRDMDQFFDPDLSAQEAGISRAAWPLFGVATVYAQYRLASLYEQVGRTDDAITLYRELIDLWSDGDAVGQARVREMQARVDALGG